MRNRQSGRGNIWKILFGVGVLAGVCVILISLMKRNDIKQVEGEYMSLREASLLVEQLECQVPWTGQGESEYLTYGQYIELLDFLAQTHPDKFKDSDYERYATGILSAEYDKKHTMLKSDFINSYLELVNVFVPEKEIETDSFVVLGGAGEVYSLMEEPLSEGQVLVARGEEAETEEITFREYKNYLYEEVDVIKSNTEVILPLERKAGEFTLKRAWVGSNTDQGLKVYYKGKMIVFPYQKDVYDSFEEIVDLSFKDKKLAQVQKYEQKINGRLMALTEDSMELENMGTYKLAEDIQVYKLYGTKEQYTVSDLKIGYDFTDFILDGDTVIAALVTREEAMENIRVAIKTNDFAGLYHEKVSVIPDCDYTVYTGEEAKEYPAGELFEVDLNSDLFEKGRIKIVPKALTGKIIFHNLKRAQGTPVYGGTMELSLTEQGIVVINELLLEEYLYSVVPSEMPASYPAEALKAQAITARTYAYRNMQKSALPNIGAHVDDSVSYQVYNNISQSESTTLAVRETSGKVILYNGKPADTYYYSTSCGYSTDLSAWGTELSASNAYLTAKHIGHGGQGSGDETEETLQNQAKEIRDNATFEAFIKEKQENDFEKEQDYYRWTYETKLDSDLMLERLQERYGAKQSQILTKLSDGSFESKEPKKLGKITGIEVLKRSAGGAISELMIYGSKNTYKIISEYNVRYILRNESTKITKQSGEEGSVSSLLPSSFFAIALEGEEEVEAYTLTGGGYGHGIGMSQNGAKAMSEAGYTCDEILNFFYTDIDVLAVNEM